MKNTVLFMGSCVLLLLLLAFVQGADNVQQPQPEKLTDDAARRAERASSIIFRKVHPKCRMHVVHCETSVLIRKRIDITTLIFESTDDTIFKVKFVEVCNDTNLCSYEHFGVNETIFNENKYIYYRIEIDSGLIGGADILVKQKETSEEVARSEYVVVEPKRIIDIIFDVWLYAFGVFISLLMGVLLDRHSLVKIIKMPKAIAIGFCCQYLMMPVLAFCVTRVFHLTPVEALALFIYGCCPGGAGSNNWTILFDGDLDLSAVLTFVSTCSSMIMLPAWVYSLGSVLSREAHIKIPLLGLFSNLLITICPCLIGLVIAYYFPKIKAIALKIAKPFTLIIFISFLALICVTKFHLFKLVKLRHWVSAPLVPCTGYFLAGLIAFLLRLPFNQVKTVAIETGIQNVGIAFLIVYTNMPSPASDYATFPLFAVAFSTTPPLYLLLIIYRIIMHKKKSTQKRNKSSAELSKQSDLKKEAVASVEAEPLKSNGQDA